MSAPAGPNSLDSRTFSSAKQSTIASSSEISSPTHLIYNHQNYKPDQELSTKVRKANHLIGNYISQIIHSRNFYKIFLHDRVISEIQVRRACERISENVHICANEPSLAFYRLAEHVRKALPPTVESRVQVKRLHQQLLGVYYDAEYGLE